MNERNCHALCKIKQLLGIYKKGESNKPEKNQQNRTIRKNIKQQLHHITTIFHFPYSGIKIFITNSLKK
jgi:hypothetical protein